MFLSNRRSYFRQVTAETKLCNEFKITLGYVLPVNRQKCLTRYCNYSHFLKEVRHIKIFQFSKKKIFWKKVKKEKVKAKLEAIFNRMTRLHALQRRENKGDKSVESGKKKQRTEQNQVFWQNINSKTEDWAVFVRSYCTMAEGNTKTCIFLSCCCGHFFQPAVGHHI